MARSAAELAKPHSSMITPDNCALLLVDHQSQMAFSLSNFDVNDVVSNTAQLAASARLFKVPTLLSTVSESFTGPIFDDILAEVDDEVRANIIDRTTVNAWEDERFVEWVLNTGRNRLVVAGLWSEVCLAYPVISAIEAGFDVHFVEDACGGLSETSHRAAVERMLQAGAIPMSSAQFLYELHRDWANEEVYDDVLNIAKKFQGAFGIGIEYYQYLQRTNTQ